MIHHKEHAGKTLGMVAEIIIKPIYTPYIVEIPGVYLVILQVEDGSLTWDQWFVKGVAFAIY